MLIVICYDISNDKRRTKVYEVLKDYGCWIHYSVFECSLKRDVFLNLKTHLEKIIDKKKDSIIFYILCSDCQSKIDSLGRDISHDNINEKQTTIII